MGDGRWMHGWKVQYEEPLANGVDQFVGVRQRRKFQIVDLRKLIRSDARARSAYDRYRNFCRKSF
jgi:hypothetical protein